MSQQDKPKNAKAGDKRLPVLPMTRPGASDCGDGSCGCGCGFPFARDSR